MIRRILALVLFTIVLAGCTTNLLRPPREEWPEIGQEFARSLRWSGVDRAATFFAPDARTAFVAAYGQEEGLQLTNVRHDAGGTVLGDKVRGTLVLEYYRSPSVSLRNVHIPLEWSCIEVGSFLPCRWLITTELSRLP